MRIWQIVVLFLLLSSNNGLAITWRLGLSSGLMQQPTSNYFHLVRGGYGEFATDSNAINLRLGYLERPQFIANGFRDQESFAYIGIGHAHKFMHILALSMHLGSGRVNGFVKADDPLIETSRYQLDGLMASMEAVISLGKIEFAIAFRKR